VHRLILWLLGGAASWLARTMAPLEVSTKLSPAAVSGEGSEKRNRHGAVSFVRIARRRNREEGGVERLIGPVPPGLPPGVDFSYAHCKV
jgi:hypothetical protein